MEELKLDGKITRLKCRRSVTEADNSTFTFNGKFDAQLKTEFFLRKYQEDSKNEEKTVKLEQDRIYHTCHILP